MFVNFFPITNLAESGPLTWDMVKQIIESQHNLAMWGITALVGLAVLLVAGSWIWNLFLRRHELQKAIESLKSEIFTKGKEDFAKLSERTKDEIGKMENRVEKTIEERITRFDETAEERMTLFGAEEARLFALANVQMRQWENVVAWWARAVAGYAKTKKGLLLRIAVNRLNSSLEKCKKLEDDYRKEVKKCLSSIPGLLEDEKRQIARKLNKLPKEITKQSETRPN